MEQGVHSKNSINKELSKRFFVDLQGLDIDFVSPKLEDTSTEFIDLIALLIYSAADMRLQEVPDGFKLHVWDNKLSKNCSVFNEDYREGVSKPGYYIKRLREHHNLGNDFVISLFGWKLHVDWNLENGLYTQSRTFFLSTNKTAVTEDPIYGQRISSLDMSDDDPSDE